MESLSETENQELVDLNRKFNELYLKHPKQLKNDIFLALGEVILSFGACTILDELITPLLDSSSQAVLNSADLIFLIGVCYHAMVHGLDKSKNILEEMNSINLKMLILENNEEKKLGDSKRLVLKKN